MIAIYTPYINARLKYVADYIFSDRLGLPFVLLKTGEALPGNISAKLYYGCAGEGNHIAFEASGLLEEEDIRQHVPELTLHHGTSVIFANHSMSGFDIFSAVFYCLSRYEEYVVKARDQHGRFSAANALMNNGGKLGEPLVDVWIAHLKQRLIQHCGIPDTAFKKNIFSIQPTLDIDSVFAYKGRPGFRQLAGFLKSAITFNGYEFGKRWQVLNGGTKDPNDNFDRHLELLDRYGLKAVYFFQTGPYGRYDKNISPLHPHFRKIVQQIADKGHAIGLHPSYASNSNAQQIAAEKNILEHITGRPVTASRQHFLKFDLPDTFEALCSIGITDEYSMGYSDTPGFRASTAHAFKWFNLNKNEATGLRIHPFSAMDVSYKQHGVMSSEEAINAIRQQKALLKKAGSPFTFIFHNESLSGHRGWQNWDKVFETCLKHED